MQIAAWMLIYGLLLEYCEYSQLIGRQQTKLWCIQILMMSKMYEIFTGTKKKEITFKKYCQQFISLLLWVKK